jgi:VWFA-related protein
VAGLSRDEFAVEEGGRPQSITGFEPVVVRDARPKAADAPRLSAGRLRAPSEGRSLFVYVDDIHVRPASVERVRAALRRFLEADVREGDWVTLVAPEQQLWWVARNGWEYRQLAAVSDRLVGQGGGDGYEDWAAVRALEYGLSGATGGRAVMAGGGTPPGGPGRPGDDEVTAGVGRPDVAFLAEENVALVKRRTGMTLGGLRQALESLVPQRGHKSLVLISEGFLLLPKMPGYDEVIDLARRAHVAIHHLDPRGLETGFRDASSPGSQPTELPGTKFALPALDTEGVALVTGGHAFGPTDAQEALRRVAAESEAYYLLGYSPDQPGEGERKVKVRVKREGLKAIARSRYFASPSPTAGAAASAAGRRGKGDATVETSPALVAMRSLADTDLHASRLSLRGNKKARSRRCSRPRSPAWEYERLFCSSRRPRARRRPAGGTSSGLPEVTGVPVILARHTRPCLAGASSWRTRRPAHGDRPAHVRGPRPASGCRRRSSPGADAPGKRSRSPRPHRDGDRTASTACTGAGGAGTTGAARSAPGRPPGDAPARGPAH